MSSGVRAICPLDRASRILPCGHTGLIIQFDFVEASRDIT